MIALAQTIDEARSGSRAARGELETWLYSRLREIASGFLERERTGHTLQPTALVHEGWMRLAASENLADAQKTTYLAAAAVAMRRVLIDHARAKKALKRGEGAARVALTDSEGVTPSDGAAGPATNHTEGVDIEALDTLLTALEAEHPEIAEAIQMHYFAGMSTDEIAQAQGVTDRTIRNHLAFGKAWLRDRLDGPRPPAASPPKKS